MTLVEIIIVLVLMAMLLVLFYTLFFSTQFRVIGVSKRAGGQQAVRILLARIRQELKSAISLVQIEQSRKLTIPLEDKSKPADDPLRIYYSEYEWDQDNKEIIYRKLDRDKREVNTRVWLGGDTHILNFAAFATGENERILFQYYRVMVELDHVNIKLRTKKKKQDDGGAGAAGGEDKPEPGDVVHHVTTVYPRYVNMELRIEVPQEGSHF